ncbi:M81 family metallopeptidase [Paenibacillus sp. MBLB4367]|uniref:M81 family metallopeptidase n=1 Tax=Paenibacillus sp. MBLB4367 TaxID=3384767 RepID=UPI0039080D72
MRIVAGGIIQESNTFSLYPSSEAYFRNLAFLTGAEMERMKAVRNEIGGCYRAAQEDGGIEIAPSFYTQAISGGVLLREAYESLKRKLLTEIANAGQADGVFLAFHGAMVAEGCDDTAGDLLAEVRRLVGRDIPIVVTLDSHANVTRLMAEQADALVGYKTFPHVDHFETGIRAAKLLFALARKEVRPVTVLRKVPMILPAENHQTTDGPMHELIAEAQLGEQDGRSLVTSLFQLQPWLDIGELGFAVVVVAEDKAWAEREAERLAELAWERRHRFDIRLHTVEEVVDHAIRREGNEPIIMSDSADSTGAGSPGDSNFVLKRLLELGAHERLRCLLHIVDAPAAEAAFTAGEGSRIRLSVGYSLDARYGSPMEIEGIVTAAREGVFVFGDGFQTNLQVNMGRCAVVQIGQLSLLVMERQVYTGDPAMYRCMGLEPKDAELVLVKSATQFKSSYGVISSSMLILDTPGSSTANLRSLPFKRIERPFYPFDDNFDWKKAWT